MTHSPSLASPVKGPYGFPQAAATPTDSQLLLVAHRAGMVTPIAQMWKLRPRQVRVGTLSPVLNPRGLLCSVTCGVRVRRGHRCSRDYGPLTLPETATHTGIPRVHNSATASIPTPPPTHTMAQYSFISSIQTKCLLGSRHCAGCHPYGEQDRPPHFRQVPNTHHTHNCTFTHTQHSVHTACHRYPHRSNNSPPHTHSHRDTQEVLHTPQSSIHSPTGALTPPPSGTWTQGCQHT